MRRGEKNVEIPQTRGRRAFNVARTAPATAEPPLIAATKVKAFVPWTNSAASENRIAETAMPIRR